jgi:hypothetical protein
VLLWGAMGFHGGLVGGWFALQAGPLTLAASGPEWFVGAAGAGGANSMAERSVGWPWGDWLCCGAVGGLESA